uniref:helix-turn-helix transcriptional regulator n=1 Tax=unclassified Serratia (in: enterobacteria) TaxID=2647522 RepID=UPI000568C665
MNKHNIMAYCSCQFTRLGLEHAIYSYPELSLRANLVYYPRSGFFPSDCPVADILVVIMDGNIGETLMLRGQIMETPLRQGVRTVLISPRGCPEWLKFAILGRMNVDAELDASTPVSMLQSLLTYMLDHSQISDYHRDRSPLSPRELDIITRLLNERNPMQIARELGLSIKTVS